MTERNKILDALVGMGGAKQLLTNREELSTLFEDRFKLSDLNITARVLLHWKEKGLLPDKSDSPFFLADAEESRPKGDKSRVNRFNFFELVYLYIVQDLREIGFSIKKLKNVKKILMYNLDFLDILPHITEELIIDLKKQGLDTSVLEEIVSQKPEITEFYSKTPDIANKMTVIDSVILTTILYKQDINIMVTSNGDVSFGLINTLGQTDPNYIKRQPHIVLPLFNYLVRFLSIEKYSELYVPYKLLDEQEKLILDRVRSGRYKEIKIQSNRRNSITLELTEEFKADNAKRLEEILVKGAYQVLHVKTEKGTIKYSTIKTKEQI
ncbi:MAG: hypothetical protein DRJ10_02525 [Bacteroidetes bacterium]|nr:MAG: hypothetical protein DRJ10_02525 [Bacteroidota bacterium]